MSRLRQPRLRTADGRERGAVLVLVAILLPVLLVMTAFAVDLGRQRAARRTAQARADVIALDLARLLDGTGVPTQAQEDTAKGESGRRNNMDADKVEALEVKWGTLTRFNGKTQLIECVNCNATAVRVTSTDHVDYFFQPNGGDVSRSAIAQLDANAGFSIGSFAAAVSTADSPVLNGLLNDALGLNVLSYKGLATAELDYFGIASELGLATPEELFTTDVSAFEFLEAAAAVLQRDNPNAAELAVLNQVLAVPAPLNGLSVGDVISVQAGAENAAIGTMVNLYDFLTTAAFIANGQSGVSIPAVNLGFPGTNVTGSLNLIQGPREVYGPVGTSTGLSQAGLTATFNLGTTSLGNRVVNTLQSIIPGICGLILLGPLLCGLTSRLVEIDLTGTFSLDLASAVGTIARIGCGLPEELDIDTRSDLVTTNLTLAAVVKVGGTVVLNTPLSVHAGGGDANGAADFVLPPDEFDVFKAVNPGSGSLGLDTIDIQGLGALGTLVTPVLNTLLSSTISTLNSNIVLPVSNALGIRVAGADVAPKAVDCNNVRLVG